MALLWYWAMASLFWLFCSTFVSAWWCYLDVHWGMAGVVPVSWLSVMYKPTVEQASWLHGNMLCWGEIKLGKWDFSPPRSSLNTSNEVYYSSFFLCVSLFLHCSRLCCVSCAQRQLSPPRPRVLLYLSHGRSALPFQLKYFYSIPLLYY